MRLLGIWFSMRPLWRRVIVGTSLAGLGAWALLASIPPRCIDEFEFGRALDREARELGAEVGFARFVMDEYHEAEKRGNIRPDISFGIGGRASMTGGSTSMITRGDERVICTEIRRERGVCYVDLVGAEALGREIEEAIRETFPKLKVGFTSRATAPR